jgi:hypothetical protein
MKKLLAPVFLFTALTSLALAQGEPEHFGQRSAGTSPRFSTCTAGTDSYLTSTCAVTPSATTINVNNWYTSDICTAIRSALATISSGTAVTLDARGITGSGVTCSVNPFFSSGGSIFNVTGELLLGNVVIDATTTWTIPTRFWVRGIGLSNQASGSNQNTIIKATSWSGTVCTLSLDLNGTSTNNTYCPVIFIGDPGTTGAFNQSDVFAAGIANLSVDCNSSSSCIGAASVEVQEGGGIDTVSFLNQAVACVDFDGITRKTPGTAGISNSFLRNINCTTPTATSETMNGIVIDASDGPAEISNVSVTVPGGGTSFFITGACLVINGANGVNVNYLHCEHAIEGITLGATTTGTFGIVNAVNIHGLTAANMFSTASNPTALLIQNANSVTLEGLFVTGSGTATKGVIDNVNSVSIKDQNLAHYAFSQNGSPSHTVLVTTSSNTPWILGSEVFTSLSSSAQDGSMTYCSDCKVTSSTNNVCASGGSGAFAKRVNGSWLCN